MAYNGEGIATTRTKINLKAFKKCFIPRTNKATLSLIFKFFVFVHWVHYKRFPLTCALPRKNGQIITQVKNKNCYH